MDSRIPDFYTFDADERLSLVADRAGLSDATRAAVAESAERATLDGLSENVVGSITLPLGVATNFRIDGEDRLVPMATEESSVVAAASHGARMAREGGGFHTSTTGPYMIAQVQVVDCPDPHAARSRLLEAADEIRAEANDQGVLVSHGGGCEEVSVRVIDTPRGEMVVVHLLVNTQDAMGANAVNTMAEGVAPLVASVAEGEVSLRILSNLADCRLARARCTIPPEVFDREDTELTGGEVRDRIVDAWAFAAADPYRAATHNKGVLNGVDALALATLNDWRALEAGAHAYAATRGGGYGPLTTYEVDGDGNLSCVIELPVQVGTVGGATSVHGGASAAMEILGVESADEFARVFAALGLAENLASLRALVAEGIQAGHMKLHAQNVAREAGAPEELVGEVAERLVADGTVSQSRARELLDELTD
ncbi:MAG: hydroxymethylglutaryl-CoA reductase, degradative [Halobaculum sp.]